LKSVDPQASKQLFGCQSRLQNQQQQDRQALLKAKYCLPVLSRQKMHKKPCEPLTYDLEIQ